jgi:hypothetical protein
MQKHLNAEEARVKATHSRTNAAPVGADDESHDHDCDDDGTADASEVGESPRGFCIQAMRLEAGQ